MLITLLIIIQAFLLSNQLWTQNSAPAKPKFCKDGWVHYEGFCYLLIGGPTTDTNFHQALNNCSTIGSRLFEPRHLAQQIIVNEMVKKVEKRTKPYVWLGVSKVGAKGIYVSSGKVVSSDLENLRYFEPTILSCVEMDINSGKWMAANCNENLPFICEYELK